MVQAPNNEQVYLIVWKRFHMAVLTAQACAEYGEFEQAQYWHSVANMLAYQFEAEDKINAHDALHSCESEIQRQIIKRGER